MKALNQVENREDFILDLLTALREDGAFEGRYGAPDELLLHSGGPQSDLSKQSLLMGPATRRYIVRQRFLDPHSVEGSPLRGDIDLQTNPTPIQIHVEDWNDDWTFREIVYGDDLADGLRQLSAHLPPVKGDGFQAGGLAGLLTYDMVQHTEPLRFHHPPDENSILMILYRADRWIVHDRTDSRV